MSISYETESSHDSILLQCRLQELRMVSVHDPEWESGAKKNGACSNYAKTKK